MANFRYHVCSRKSCSLKTRKSYGDMVGDYTKRLCFGVLSSDYLLDSAEALREDEMKVKEQLERLKRGESLDSY